MMTGKTIAVAAIAALMLTAASVTAPQRTAREPEPDASYVAYMRNVYRLSPGEGELYCARYPELASMIRGETEIPPR